MAQKPGGGLWPGRVSANQLIPEKGTEAHLRPLIQFCPNVKVIFSGSQHNMLLGMFTDKRWPFYQSTDLMELKTIDKQDYMDFIQLHFEDGKHQFEPEVISEWLDRIRIIPIRSNWR